MRRFAIALAVVGIGALGFFGTRASLADDPKPLTETEQARVKTLIENLGSDDFRVREAASKELIGFGERARTQLEAARNSDAPEVRFRADQLVRRLDGKNRERPLDDGHPADEGKPPAPHGPGFGGAPHGPGGWGLPFGDEEFGRWMKDLERRMQEWRSEAERRFGAFPAPRRAARRPVFSADGAELRLLPQGARLSITEKGAETSVTHAYEGKTLDAILTAYPDLKDRKDVQAILEQVKKAEAEEEARAQSAPAPFSFESRSQGVQVESTPGHVKVTITEPGPDGKPVSKTYESTDLETLKKEHPELADKLGGITFRFGFGGTDEKPFGFPEGEDPWRRALGGAATGPFGLGLAAVEPARRAELKLGDGKGAVVVAVREGSDAAKLGLRIDDVLVSVNGTAVTWDEGPTSARELLRAAKDGAMTVEVVRAGKTLTLTK